MSGAEGSKVGQHLLSQGRERRPGWGEKRTPAQRGLAVSRETARELGEGERCGRRSHKGAILEDTGVTSGAGQPSLGWTARPRRPPATGGRPDRGWGLVEVVGW